jgi:hypothetical protein
MDSLLGFGLKNLSRAFHGRFSVEIWCNHGT